MGRVLILHEKHDTRHLVVDTDEQLQEKALEVLTERFEEGYWYYDPRTENHPFSLNLRKERDELITAYPDPDEAPAAIKGNVQRAHKDKLEDEQDANLIERIRVTIETGNGKAAWSILRERNDHEYEGVELKELQ